MSYVNKWLSYQDVNDTTKSYQVTLTKSHVNEGYIYCHMFEFLVIQLSKNFEWNSGQSHI